MTRTYHSAFHRLHASIVPMVCLLIGGLALPIDAVAKTKAKKAFQIFFDLDVLSILLPVLYVCVRYSIIEYKESNTITECAD